jgi:hypothetical protein
MSDDSEPPLEVRHIGPEGASAPDQAEPGDTPVPATEPGHAVVATAPLVSDRIREWVRSAQLPQLTVGVFLVFAAALWLNAIINRYRFNVVVALVGSVPLMVLLIRGAVLARDDTGRSG